MDGPLGHNLWVTTVLVEILKETEYLKIMLTQGITFRLGGMTM